MVLELGALARCSLDFDHEKRLAAAASRCRLAKDESKCLPSTRDGHQHHHYHRKPLSMPLPQTVAYQPSSQVFYHPPGQARLAAAASPEISATPRLSHNGQSTATTPASPPSPLSSSKTTFPRRSGSVAVAHTPSSPEPKDAPALQPASRSRAVALPSPPGESMPDARRALYLRDAPEPQPAVSLKRRRPLSDVDGPNTGHLSSKKRRLGWRLITSRLSLPFSLPATHILNRKSKTPARNRFLTLTTAGVAVQRQHDTQSHALRRFATVNRTRSRFMTERLDDWRSRCAGAYETAQVLQLCSRASFLRPGSSHAANVQPAAAKPAAKPGSSAAWAASSQQSFKLPTPLAMLRSQESPATQVRRASPSPEFRPTIPLDDPDDEEAFLSADYGPDEPDHVYSDFGVLFGNGSTDGAASQDLGVDDYLDELDGISWVSR